MVPADIRSAGGRRFTAGELLCEVYRASVADVRRDAHHVFEGLRLSACLGGFSSWRPRRVPVYLMRLGS